MNDIEREARAEQRKLSNEFFLELSPEQIFEAGYIAGASRPAPIEPRERTFTRWQSTERTFAIFSEGS